jgi:hypothetical protein
MFIAALSQFLAGKQFPQIEIMHDKQSGQTLLTLHLNF